MKTLALLLLTVTMACAQSVHPTSQQYAEMVKKSQDKAVPITVKATPASDALNAAAKDLTTEQKAFDTLLNQAKATADTDAKVLQQQLLDASNALQKQLRADKKYAPQLAEIDALQKQLTDLQQTAQQKFAASAGPIQAALQKDRALVDGLTPVVRAENPELTKDAQFDAATGVWK